MLPKGEFYYKSLIFSWPIAVSSEPSPSLCAFDGTDEVTQCADRYVQSPAGGRNVQPSFGAKGSPWTSRRSMPAVLTGDVLLPSSNKVASIRSVHGKRLAMSIPAEELFDTLVSSSSSSSSPAVTSWRHGYSRTEIADSAMRVGRAHSTNVLPSAAHAADDEDADEVDRYRRLTTGRRMSESVSSSSSTASSQIVVVDRHPSMPDVYGPVVIGTVERGRRLGRDSCFSVSSPTSTGAITPPSGICHRVVDRRPGSAISVHEMTSHQHNAADVAFRDSLRSCRVATSSRMCSTCVNAEDDEVSVHQETFPADDSQRPSVAVPTAAERLGIRPPPPPRRPQLPDHLRLQLLAADGRASSSSQCYSSGQREDAASPASVGRSDGSEQRAAVCSSGSCSAITPGSGSRRCRPVEQHTRRRRIISSSPPPDADQWCPTSPATVIVGCLDVRPDHISLLKPFQSSTAKPVSTDVDPRMSKQEDDKLVVGKQPLKTPGGHSMRSFRDCDVHYDVMRGGTAVADRSTGALSGGNSCSLDASLDGSLNNGHKQLVDPANATKATAKMTERSVAEILSPDCIFQPPMFGNTLSTAETILNRTSCYHDTWNPPIDDAAPAAAHRDSYDEDVDDSSLLIIPPPPGFSDDDDVANTPKIACCVPSAVSF